MKTHHHQDVRSPASVETGPFQERYTSVFAKNWNRPIVQKTGAEDDQSMGWREASGVTLVLIALLALSAVVPALVIGIPLAIDFVITGLLYLAML